jgi:hypothetical protein
MNLPFRGFVSLFVCLLLGCGATDAGRTSPARPRAVVSGPDGDGFDGSGNDFIGNRYGISQEAAAFRASAELQLSGLEGFETANPALFAGAWIDDTAEGRVHIALVNPTTAQASAAVAGFPAGYPVDVSAAAFSEAQLEAWLDALPNSAAINHAAVDEQNNRLAIAAFPGSGAAVTALVAPLFPAGSYQVTEDADLPDDTSCTGRNNCGHPLRGGVEIVPDDQNDDSCSLGFIALGPEGHHFALTAGHCAPTGHTYSVNSPDEIILRQIGGVEHRQYSGPLDAEVIKVQTPWDDDSAGWLFQTTSQKKVPVIASIGIKGIHQGMLLCRGGYHTGQICGTVRDRRARITRRNGAVFTRQLVVNGCALRGDSGGPVYQPITRIINLTTHLYEYQAKAVAIEGASNYIKGNQTTPDKCAANPFFTGSYTSEYYAQFDIHVAHQN